MSIAVAHKGTVRELSDIWMHAHFYKLIKNDYQDPVERVRQEIEELNSARDVRRQRTEETNYMLAFRHKKFGTMFLNWFKFIVSGR